MYNIYFLFVAEFIISRFALLFPFNISKGKSKVDGLLMDNVTSTMAKQRKFG